MGPERREVPNSPSRRRLIEGRVRRWLARIGRSATFFTAVVPRVPPSKSTAHRLYGQEAALAEGLAPLMAWSKRLGAAPTSSKTGWAHADLEFAWASLRPADPPAEQVKDARHLFLRDGHLTINDARDILGFDPVAVGSFRWSTAATDRSLLTQLSPRRAPAHRFRSPETRS